MSMSRREQLVEMYDEDVADSAILDADRKYWALYRTLDMTQSEVIDAVRADAEPSQSTVSRAINEGDDRVLFEGEDYIGLYTTFHKDLLEPTDQQFPDEWVEAHRDVLARAKTDQTALERIRRRALTTPEWAARRFPELVGCSYEAYQDFPNDQIADESHLSHLEGVNTDRWK